MRKVNCPSITVRLYPYVTNIAISCGYYRQVLTLLCSHINPHMVVIGTQVAKVAGERRRNIQWINEIVMRVCLRLLASSRSGNIKRGNKKKKKGNKTTHLGSW